MTPKQQALANFLRERCNDSKVCNDTCTGKCRCNIAAKRQAELFSAGWDAAMNLLKHTALDDAVDIILNNKEEE